MNQAFLSFIKKIFTITLVFCLFSFGATNALAQAVWSAPEVVATRSVLGNITVDTSGTIHAIWEGGLGTGEGEAYYSFKSPSSSTWAIPKNLTKSQNSISKPLIAVGGDNVVHAVWLSQIDHPGFIMYSHKKNNNSWTRPEVLFESNTFDTAAGPDGTVHLVWVSDALGEILYSSHQPQTNGPEQTWTPPVNISNTSTDSTKPEIAVASNGSIHVVWGDTSGGVELYYMTKSITGQWSTPEFIPGIDRQSAKITTDSFGNPHVVGDHNGQVAYTTKNNGSWTSVVDVGDPLVPGYRDIAITPDQIPHITFQYGSGAGVVTMYSTLTPTGWTTPVSVSGSTVGVNPHSLAAAPDGSLHVIFDVEGNPYIDIYYVSGIPQ